jgi:carboxypeptidase D
VIEVKGINHDILTTKLGQFWRLLAPGTYEVSVHAYDYVSSDVVTVTVDERTLRRAEPLNFELKSSSAASQIGSGSDKPIGNNKSASPTSTRRLDNGFLRPPSYQYRNYEDMKAFLAFYAHNYPNLTRLYSIGKSVNGRDLWVLEITDNPGIHEALEPGFYNNYCSLFIFS